MGSNPLSRWGLPADARMIAASKKARLHSSVIDSLLAHSSSQLTRAEVLSPDTVLFLNTKQHGEWAHEIVGDDAVELARKQGRLILVDPDFNDVPDPYLDERLYPNVCDTISRKVPLTLRKLLEQKGLLSAPAVDER
jgi:hypothetical protein